jgi:hypothetical protein
MFNVLGLVGWFLVLIPTSKAEDSTLNQLKLIQQQLFQSSSHNSSTLIRQKCLNQYGQQSFISPYLSNMEPVLLCSVPVTESQWGNRIGEYFEAIACADIVGIHFIDTSNDLVKDIPSIRMHTHPIKLNHGNTSEITSIRELLLSTCPELKRFPYVQRGAWNRRISLIREVFTGILTQSFPSAYSQQLPAHTFDIISSPIPVISPNHLLPLIPNAAILFRCKDILLGDPRTHPYGFVNYNVYQQLIKQNATSIYILSEPLNYLHNSSLSSLNIALCMKLTTALKDHLSVYFPTAVIALRRGHAMDSIAMLSFTPTVICAPSTFCLWPGIASNQSVFFAPGLVIKTMPFISANFHWLLEPHFIRLGGVVRESYHNKYVNFSKANRLNATVQYVLDVLMKPVTLQDFQSVHELKEDGVYLCGHSGGLPCRQNTTNHTID